jgi:CelD/BcsL family acetyltransferase involved in cellulose biosynthesis
MEPLQRCPPAGPVSVMDTPAPPPAPTSDWDLLAHETSAKPWLRVEWVHAWCEAFGAGRRLHVAAARRDGRVVALAPVFRHHGVVRSATNYHTPDYALLAVDDAALRTLAIALLAGGRQVRLEFVDSSEPTVSLFRAAAEQARFRVLSRVLERPPYVATDGTWSDYERSRDSALLRDLRRRRRRLAEQGSVAFEIVDGSQRLSTMLDECFLVEQSGWKGTSGTAIASQPATRAFYSRVAEQAAARGELRLAFLRLDGRPIAAQLAIEAGGAFTVLKLGHDEAFARFAPGKLLIQSVLEHCFASQVITRLDFSGHDDPYKMEWATGRRELLVLQAFRRSPAGLVDWLAWRHGRPFVKRIASRRRG